MSAAVSYERVRDQLATLGLDAALTSLDPVLARGQQDAKVAVEVLDSVSSSPRASSGGSPRIGNSRGSRRSRRSSRSTSPRSPRSPSRPSMN
jgi:hypothetical protein